MKLRDAIREGAERLKLAGIDSAARDMRLLAAMAAGISTDRVTLALDEEIAPEAQATLDRLVTARSERRPMSHLTGSRRFLWHEFRVTPDTLDPRPETELLVQAVIDEPFRRVLDLGTGTGCILLSLLHAMPEATGIGTDISAAALDVARENAERVGVSGRASFVEADWLDGIEGGFDLVVSNPPYISEEEMAHLAPEVRDWEPRGALTPGGDGLGAYRAIAMQVAQHLLPDGRVAFEIGPTQAEAVSELLRAAAFPSIEVRKDLDGRDRIVLARMTGGSCP